MIINSFEYIWSGFYHFFIFLMKNGFCHSSVKKYTKIVNLVSKPILKKIVIGYFYLPSLMSIPEAPSCRVKVAPNFSSLHIMHEINFCCSWYFFFLGPTIPILLWLFPLRIGKSEINSSIKYFRWDERYGDMIFWLLVWDLCYPQNKSCVIHKLFVCQEN